MKQLFLTCPRQISLWCAFLSRLVALCTGQDKCLWEGSLTFNVHYILKEKLTLFELYNCYLEKIISTEHSNNTILILS